MRTLNLCLIVFATALQANAQVTTVPAPAPEAPTVQAPEVDFPKHSAIVECRVPNACRFSRWVNPPNWTSLGGGKYVANIPCSVPQKLRKRIIEKFGGALTGSKPTETLTSGSVIPFEVKGPFTFRVRVLQPHEDQEPICHVQ